MERGIEKYMRKHTRLVAVLLISIFLLLGLGEYYLYRKVMQLNQVVSEGFMQIKEISKPKEPVMMKK